MRAAMINRPRNIIPRVGFDAMLRLCLEPRLLPAITKPKNDQRHPSYPEEKTCREMSWRTIRVKLSKILPTGVTFDRVY